MPRAASDVFTNPGQFLDGGTLDVGIATFGTGAYVDSLLVGRPGGTFSDGAGRGFRVQGNYGVLL